MRRLSLPNASQSTHTTIFALDALTGRELWNSGSQVTSFSHFAGMTVANGRIYLPTYGGELYAFDVPPKASGTTR
jgi:outer membrane protein assembly factor BamB